MEKLKGLLKSFVRSQAYARGKAVDDAERERLSELRKAAAELYRGDLALEDFAARLRVLIVEPAAPDVTGAGTRVPARAGGEAAAEGGSGRQPAKVSGRTELFEPDYTQVARFFEQLCECASKGELRIALKDLMDLRGGGDPADRLQQFGDYAQRVRDRATSPDRALSQGYAAHFATFLWSAIYDRQHPVFSRLGHEAMKALSDLGEVPGEAYSGANLGDRYRSFTRVCKMLRDALARVDPKHDYAAVERFLDWVAAGRPETQATTGGARPPVAAERPAPHLPPPRAPAAAAAPPAERPPARDVPVAPDIEALARELYLDPRVLHALAAALRERRAAILYGPSGTGKSFVALRFARFFAKDPSRVAVVQFHPAFSYTDFVEGPAEAKLAPRPGILRELASRAAEDLEHDYVLVMDEVQRGDAGAILGEVLLLLEHRDEEVILPRSREPFRLPPNLYLLGTLNDSLDAGAFRDPSLRGRFRFVALRPDPEALRRFARDRRGGLPAMDRLLEVLNRRIRSHLGPRWEVGQGPFLRTDLDEAWLRRYWEHDLMPRLEEQFRDAPGRLAEFSLDRIRAEVQAEPGGREVERASRAP